MNKNKRGCSYERGSKMNSVDEIRAAGEGQTIETLINEEPLLFSKYLREESKTWNHCLANSI